MLSKKTVGKILPQFFKFVEFELWSRLVLFFAVVLQFKSESIDLRSLWLSSFSQTHLS